MALFNGINVTLDAEAPIIDHALQYVRAGLPIFPVHGIQPVDGQLICTCGEKHDRAGKHPAVRHGYKDASLDETVVKTWYTDRPYLNIGVATGRNTVVLDADVRSDGLNTLEAWEFWTNGISLPETLRCRTGSGGLHLWYKIPDSVKITSRNLVLPGIDVKSFDGYVVASPSLHQSGNVYTWENADVDVVDAPGELITWFMTRRSGAGGDGHTPEGYEFGAGPRLGFRDTWYNEFAFRLRHKNLTWAEAVSEMERVWPTTEQDMNDVFTFGDAMAKLDRVWNTVEPEPEQDIGTGAQQFARLAAMANARPAPLPPSLPVSSPSGANSDEAGDDDTIPPEEPDHVETQTNRRAILNAPPNLETELTQAGLSHRFIRAFEGRFIFVPGVGWHRWDGVAWQVDELDDALDATQYLLQELRQEQAEADEDRQRAYVNFYATASTIVTRKMTLVGASVDPRMKAAARQLNTDPLCLVVQNGTLDLRTGRLRDSKPEDLNTQLADVTYDEDATCPRWIRHVMLVSRHADGSEDVDLAAFYQRWAGYTLTGLVKEQSFFFAHGTGDNGKNAFIETLLGMMGSYAMRGSSKILLGGSQEHETVIADLAGARMVFIDETPKGRINEARLKELTGSERIRARKMRQDSFEFDARFKLWISGNNRPSVSDTTKGFWRRLHLAPFDSEIPVLERDPAFNDKLRAERSGILNWALQGLAAYLAVGLAMPKRVMDAGHEYQDEENIFGQFVDECFVEDAASTYWTPNNVLYMAYTRWCETSGIRPTTMQKLTNEWKRYGFTHDKSNKKIKQGFPRRWITVRGLVGKPLSVSISPDLQWDGMYETMITHGDGDLFKSVASD